ncbi:MAG TPA: TadE/TadG family type IV pilus assembly protein [Actinomycetes bacterium]|nr:TadE/TadG family type IV pilus assembly protein [Actinomycetes bacterium]
MGLDGGRMRLPPGARVGPWRRHTRGNHEGGSAVVEFALVAPLAILVALAVAQFALFLYERNVVMGSLSEGARVAATSGRTVADGQRAAANLVREALGRRIAATVLVRGGVENGLVVLRSDASLASFVPGLPGLRVHMTAAMHKEEDLGVHDGTPVVATPGAATGTDEAAR